MARIAGGNPSDDQEPRLRPVCRLRGAQRPRRRRVDALVPVVPADAVARGGRPVHDLLYDARAGWSLGRFGLDLHAISGLQLHALTSRLACPSVIAETAHPWPRGAYPAGEPGGAIMSGGPDQRRG